MIPRKKRRVRRVVIGVFLALVVSLCPLPIRDADRARAVKKTYAALLDGRRVWFDWQYAPLPDHRSVVRARERYFINDTRIDDEVFIRLGLKPLDRQAWEHFPFDLYEQGNVFVEATYTNSFERTTSTDIRFNYYYGDLGAVGMRLVLYRNLFGVFVVYRHEWSS